MDNYIAQELDFDNVFILPQPSSISSRSQVNLERTFNFVNNLNDENDYDRDDIVKYKDIIASSIELL